MASNSKRNTIFPGGFKGLQIPSDRSLDSSLQLSYSKLPKNRDPHRSEGSRRPPAKSADKSSSHKSDQSERELIPLRNGSPWNAYEDRYRLELGVEFTVAGKLPRSTGEIVAVRSIAGPTVDKDIYRIRQLCHPTILPVLEIFMFEDSYYLISELMEISLDHVIATPAYPDDAELASIVWQAFGGISFLISQNLVHGDITCSNVLVSRDGDVKIVNPECCHLVDQDSPERMMDLQALGPIMVELMEKRSVERGKACLENDELWSDEASKFLSLTNSPSIEQLEKHAFFSGPPENKELVLLVHFVRTSAYQFYDYPRLRLARTKGKRERE